MSHPIYCPFLKEVTMLYCDACPQRKLLPRDQIVSSSPCLAQDFTRCPLFLEFMRRTRDAVEDDTRTREETGMEVSS